MNIKPLSVGLQGYYKIMIGKPDGSIVEATDWFPNIVTDGGLDQMMDGSSPLARICVGTGTTPPAESNTQLENIVSSTTSADAITTSAGSETPLTKTYYWQSRSKRFYFPKGSILGNISEVGIGKDASNLYSRSLIKDGNGVPITITLTSIDVLYVYYTNRIYVPYEEVTNVINLNGVPTNCTIRNGSLSWTDQKYNSDGGIGYYVGSYENWQGVYFSHVVNRTPPAQGSSVNDITGQPPSIIPPSGTGVIGGLLASYIPGTHYKTYYIKYPEGQINYAGGILGGVLATRDRYSGNFINGFSMGFVFDPPIMKNNTQTIEFRFTIRIARHVPV